MWNRVQCDECRKWKCECKPEVLCDHVRDDCKGCYHGEPHESIMDIDTDIYCTEPEECVSHEITVECQPINKEIEP